jgi:hypothetical protein
MLDQTLKGFCIIPRRQSAVIAYADDITLLLTSPEDIEAARGVITCYEKASGACLNIRKSRALAVGTWNKSTSVLDIPYSDELKVLGFVIQKSIARAACANWTRVTQLVRAQARDTYSRDLGLSQRIQYSHTYLMAKLWHTAQILPAPTDCIRQIVAAVVWFIWRGVIFQVPITILQRRRDEGGWELTDIAVKCGVLLITRLWAQSHSSDSITSDLLKHWKVPVYPKNPPDIRRFPSDLEHLRVYALEMAYFRPQQQTETPKSFRRLYDSLYTKAQAGRPKQEMRITKLHPRTNWKQVWDNLNETWAPDHMKALWYTAIHDIIPSERLHKIKLSTTPDAENVENGTR